jgi:hypothetical protein
LALSLAVNRSQAGFLLFEDFNSLSPGFINGQQGWVDSASNGRVVADPLNPANQVIAITNSQANVYRALGSLTLSNIVTGTLHFRMLWPGTGFSTYAGLTDIPTPTPGTVADYEPHVRCEPAAPAVFKARDAGAYDALVTLESNVWYQFWMVVDNSRDLFRLYIQGGVFSQQTQLFGIADGEVWFTFRNTTGDGFNTNTAPQSAALVCFNLKTTSSHVGPYYVDDVFIDPVAANLSNPLPQFPDTNAPVITNIHPPPGADVTALSAITVTFDEPVTDVAAEHLQVNGAPASSLSGSAATWTWLFAQPPFGNVDVTWANDHTISDLASNRFDATASSWSYTLSAVDTTPPAISSVSPAAGSVVSNLSTVTVTFTEPVLVIEAPDLLVNGVPATGISGNGNQRTFTFSQPGPGLVQFHWDGAHAISDDLGNRFNETLPAASWSYTLLDKSPPSPVAIYPVPSAAVGTLTNIEITFNEPVTGLDAGDLRISNVPATVVTGSGAGPYSFTFAQPANGTVIMSWSGGHGIQDTASPPNGFVGSTWSYTVSPLASLPAIVLNEILAENLTGLTDDDGDTSDWMEIHNRSASAINLTGWSLTDDPTQPGRWVFPARTLTAGQFLVVFASSKNRRPPTPGTNLHTNFRLGSSGYLGLFNSELPRRIVSEFAPEYPEQRGDIAWGLAGATNLTYFATPTPGGSNTSSATYVGVAAMPAASAASGFFNLPFNVALSTRTPGANIFYTLDGSVPTSSSLPYSTPIPIAGTPSKAVVTLRAVALKNGWLSSPVLTRTFIFPDHVPTQPALPAGFPAVWDSPCTVGSNCRDTAGDYEMDPQVVNAGTNAALIRKALTEMPSLSIVTDVNLLFGPAQGVYVRREDFNQQPVNVEFLLPDGSDGFQADCGLEIQGGTSPTDSGGDWKSKALSMRLLFRGDFGPVTKLRYPLFPDSPVEEFNTLILDAGLNFTWHHMTDSDQRNRADYVRDQFTSDLMNAVGLTAPHGRFVHVYLNGLYWGICDLHERADESFYADYFGGDKTEYDILKHTGNSAGLQSGNLTAWNSMFTAARAGLDSQAAYDAFAAQHLDVPWFIDYMLVNHWVGNTDWDHHNWYAGRRRAPGALWRFVSWDAEHVIKDANHNRITVNNANSATELFHLLRANPEFRLQFADHIHRHCFNGGVFYADPANPNWSADHPERDRAADRYMKRIQEIDSSVAAESARWGDVATARTNQPYTRELEFWREVNSLLGRTNVAGNTANYFPRRNAIVLDQYRTESLYPWVVAPTFRQHGGKVAPGYSLFLTNLHTGGMVYFTTNGTDPRVYGSGAVNAQAQPWLGVPVTLGQTTTVKARCLDGTEWSALNEATFDIAPLTAQLAVTELMYNPPGGDDYEFFELRNVGLTEFDASGCTFEGVDYAFLPGTRLAPGQVVVLANNDNPAAFASRYPGASVFGWYDGRLDNGGERLALKRPTGEIIFSLDYDDDLGWLKEADGSGSSLEIMDALGDLDAPSNWRASTYLGTPGSLSTNPPLPAVQLNEVMARNASALSVNGKFPDWVELFNSSASPVNLAGWSLSDDGNARKFVFPAGTVIDEGGFLTVWFDPDLTLPGLNTGFALSFQGETVSLYNAMTTRVDAVTFGLQPPDYSLGRVANQWVLTTPTLTAANLAATVAAPGSLFVNEWLANAPPGGSDWLELFNAASLPVALRGSVLTCNDKVHQIQSLSFLAARSHWQLFADEQPGVDHLDLTLPAEGSALALYDATSVERNRVAFGPQTEDVSQGRLPDGSGTITSFALTSSPGASNYVSTYTGPRLNELIALNRTILTNATGHTADWVELFNPNAAQFNLAGYRLGVKADAASAWVIPAGVVIPGYGHLLVWFSNDHPPSTSSSGELHSGRALTGGGDSVYLFNPQGQIVDAVEFGVQSPDLSLGRVGSQWRLLAAPTPGNSNSAPATLGNAALLKFNEWLAQPLTGQQEFFELFNTGTQPVELSGLYLSDDLSLAGRMQFQIPPLSFIGPRGFAVFKADGQSSAGADHVNFKLDLDAESLRLYQTNLTAIDTMVTGLQPIGAAEGALPDGTGTVVALPCPTPGSSNTNTDLVITGQPQSQSLVPGDTTWLKVFASGGGWLIYQWLHQDVPIPGATNSTLRLSPVQSTDAGDYQVIVANSCTTVTSTVATLSLPLPPQLGGAMKLDGNSFLFYLQGQVGSQYAIEKSTNLFNWIFLGSVTLTNSPWPVLDPSATQAGSAFYRARQLP